MNVGGRTYQIRSSHFNSNGVSGAPLLNSGIMPGYPGVGVSGYPGVGVAGYPGAGVGLGVSGYPGAGLGVSGYPGVGLSGFPGAGVAGFPGINNGFGLSGTPGTGTPGVGLVKGQAVYLVNLLNQAQLNGAPMMV